MVVQLVQGVRRRRSIVLAPIKVRSNDGGFTLSWTYNLAKECRNGGCFYAKARMAGQGSP